MNRIRSLRTALLVIGIVAGVGLLAAFVWRGNYGTEPERLRVGVLPGEESDILRARFEPLTRYLSREVGLPCDLVIPADYDELVGLFVDGEIDLAYFGGVTFVQAEARAGALPLVIRGRDLDFRSYILVRADFPARSLAEIKGTRFAFGSRLSTSGHLMPRYFMLRDGIVPETWFSDVLYSGAHDVTAYWVRDGLVDAGVADSAIVDAMISDGRLDRASLRVLERTPPYTDNVWATRPDMPDHLRERLRDAFLLLDRENPDHDRILEALDADRFLPALTTDFESLRLIVRDMAPSKRNGR